MNISDSLKYFFTAFATPVSWAFKHEPTGAAAKAHAQAEQMFSSPTPTGDEVKPVPKSLSNRFISRIYQMSIVQAICRLFKAYFGSKLDKEVLAFDSRVDSIKTRDQALGGDGEALKIEIESYLNAHPKLSEDMKLHALKALQTLKSVMKLFKMHENILELSKFPLDEKGGLDVPPDGNCMYHSIHAALMLGIGSTDIPDSLTLRVQTVQDMRELYKNDTMLELIINDTIAQFNKKEESEINEELSSLAVEKDLANLTPSQVAEAETKIRNDHPPIASIDEFFERAAQPKFWGSTPDLYVLAKRYKVQFITTAVLKEPNSKVEKIIYFEKATAGQDGDRKVYLKLTNNNHYDLYLAKTQEAAG